MHGTRPSLIRALAAAAGFLLSLSAVAGEVRVNAGGAANLVFIDRTGLDGLGIVTEVKPSVSVNAQGARLSGRLGYTGSHVENLAPETGRNTAHNLLANFKAELFEDTVFLDGRARAGLTSADSTVQAVDNIDRDSGVRQSYSLELKPSIRKRLGRFAILTNTYKLGYRDTAGSSGSAWDEQTALNITSGKDFGVLRWGLKLSRSSQHFDDRVDHRQSAAANARYRFDREFDGIFKVRYENDDTASFRTDTERVFVDSLLGWRPGRKFNGSLGVSFASDNSDPSVIGSANWQPNPRTNAKLTVGRRFFGTTVRGELSHRTRNSRIQVSLNHDIRNVQTNSLDTLSVPVLDDDGLQILDPDTGEPVFADGLVVRDSSENFIDTNLRGQYTIRGGKTSVSLQARAAQREFEVTRNEEQSFDVSAQVTRRIVDGFTGSASLQVGTVSTDFGDDADTWSTTARLLKRLGRKTSASVQYRYRSVDQVGNDQNEHRLTLGLRTRFD